MTEIRASLKNIRNVEIKSKVMAVKDADSKVVTAVKFEYDGEPSEVQDIPLLEAQGKPVYADLFSPQITFALDEKD